MLRSISASRNLAAVGFRVLQVECILQVKNGQKPFYNIIQSSFKRSPIGKFSLPFSPQHEPFLPLAVSLSLHRATG